MGTDKLPEFLMKINGLCINNIPKITDDIVKIWVYLTSTQQIKDVDEEDTIDASELLAINQEARKEKRQEKH